MSTYNTGRFSQKAAPTNPGLKFSVVTLGPLKYTCLLAFLTLVVCVVAGTIQLFQYYPLIEPSPDQTQNNNIEFRDNKAGMIRPLNVPKGCVNSTMDGMDSMDSMVSMVSMGSMVVRGGQFHCPVNNPEDLCFLLCEPGLVPSNGSVFKCIKSTWVPSPGETRCVPAVAVVIGGDIAEIETVEENNDMENDAVEKNNDVEILSLEVKCEFVVPRLPRPRVWHSSVLIGGPYLRSGSALLTCGGIEDANYLKGENKDISNCIELDLSVCGAQWTHHSDFLNKSNSGRFRHNSVQVLGKVYHMGGGSVHDIQEENTVEILNTNRPIMNENIVNYFFNIDELNENNGVGKKFSTDDLNNYLIPEIAGADIPHKYYKIWRPTYLDQSLDYLPTYEDIQPQPGPRRSHPLLWTCSVRVFPDMILVTGGYHTLKQTWLYNTTAGTWTRLENADLNVGRYRHACVLIKAQAGLAVLVSGGTAMVRTEQTLTSSELLTIDFKTPQSAWKWEQVDSLKEGREGHGMVVLGGNQTQILAIGGRSITREPLRSVEVYRVEKNGWETSARKLKRPRWGFSVVGVPSSVCN